MAAAFELSLPRLENDMNFQAKNALKGSQRALTGASARRSVRAACRRVAHDGFCAQGSGATYERCRGRRGWARVAAPGRPVSPGVRPKDTPLSGCRLGLQREICLPLRIPSARPQAGGGDTSVTAG